LDFLAESDVAWIAVRLTNQAIVVFGHFEVHSGFVGRDKEIKAERY
jgi:hypothetical protein